MCRVNATVAAIFRSIDAARENAVDDLVKRHDRGLSKLKLKDRFQML
jgi:hypothetical protein